MSWGFPCPLAFSSHGWRTGQEKGHSVSAFSFLPHKLSLGRAAVFYLRWHSCWATSSPQFQLWLSSTKYVNWDVIPRRTVWESRKVCQEKAGGQHKAHWWEGCMDMQLSSDLGDTAENMHQGHPTWARRRPGSSSSNLAALPGFLLMVGPGLAMPLWFPHPTHTSVNTLFIRSSWVTPLSVPWLMMRMKTQIYCFSTLFCPNNQM
jgi:hypothetical protein